MRLTEAGRIALADAAPKMAAADAKLLKLIAGGGRRSAFVVLLQDLVGKTDSDDAKPAKDAKPVKAKAGRKSAKKAKKKAA